MKIGSGQAIIVIINADLVPLLLAAKIVNIVQINAVKCGVFNGSDR